jgi:integrase
VLQVLDVRYQAGRFGSGFKPRPKSDAGIREIPLAPWWPRPSAAAPARRRPDVLVFAGPGDGNHVATGTRTVLSRHGVRRMDQTAVKRADLDHLQLRGPHDFRHTFSTWLEDAGLPARYRHTTDAMADRVVEAVQAG